MCVFVVMLVWRAGVVLFWCDVVVVVCVVACVCASACVVVCLRVCDRSCAWLVGWWLPVCLVGYVFVCCVVVMLCVCWRGVVLVGWSVGWSVVCRFAWLRVCLCVC